VSPSHKTLDHVLELADVAWPVVGLEQRQRRPADPPNALASLGGIPFDQVFDEKRDVVRTLAERRHVDRKDVQPVEQIPPECSRGHGVLKIAIGRGQYAYIDGDRAAVAQALDLAVLEYAQQ
jgi:hypothetical protein